jgi:hypothetical protein
MSGFYSDPVNNSPFDLSDGEEGERDSPLGNYYNFIDKSDDEEEERDATMVILAAVAATVVICSNYKQGPSNFHVRDWLEWDLHIQELNSESADAFRRCILFLLLYFHRTTSDGCQ